ncbi:MAG: AmmeMemoRadiSam system radical SAM enzyme, partial [Candidatus Thiodiazotropha sp. (ex Myrtea spinifera)]|nr:AmmeMemoRadiSam system radical SAM enzyme [Candidatus Thiodiazotropha sp. (ex Myrtea spinifera)]
PSTPHDTLIRARNIAREKGVRYAYVGNVHDREASSTWCHHCGELLIQRDWYELGEWHLDMKGECEHCGTPVVGRFEQRPGHWGARRQPVRLAV